VNNPFLYSVSPDLKEVPDMLLVKGGDLGEPPMDEMGILLRPMSAEEQSLRDSAYFGGQERDCPRTERHKTL
jgi:hypothetical protein